MTANEFLSIKTEEIKPMHFTMLIQSQGINGITKKDMDKFIKHHGDIICFAGFTEYYSIISAKESNQVMKWWTIAIGIMTVVVMISTLIMVFSPLVYVDGGR